MKGMVLILMIPLAAYKTERCSTDSNHDQDGMAKVFINRLACMGKSADFFLVRYEF